MEISEDGICWTCKCGWRSTFLDLKCPGCGNGQPAIYAAITQALTESSGQGADGAEAMREIIAVATAIMRDALKGDLVTNQMTGFVKRYGALPLPVSADGRDAVIEECALAASQYPTPVALAIAANIRALKSKQPSDTGAGK